MCLAETQNNLRGSIKMIKKKGSRLLIKLRQNLIHIKSLCEVSLFLGKPLEGIGKRTNLSYNKILTYCQEEGLLNKHKNRSQTHKMKKKQDKKYRCLGKAKFKIPDVAAVKSALVNGLQLIVPVCRKKSQKQQTKLAGSRLWKERRGPKGS